MIRPKDQSLANQYRQRIQHFARTVRPLPGVATRSACDCLIAQILESNHRIEYVELIGQRPISARRLDPRSSIFDPLYAAKLHQSSGDFDEACWLVFLATHFGKHRRDGWRLCANVYGLLGNGVLTWQVVANDPQYAQRWLTSNFSAVLATNPRFGNHRKYASLLPTSSKGTGRVIESYVHWIGQNRGHRHFFDGATALGSNPEAAFDELFQSMTEVVYFGRTGKFDFLTMLGKLRLLPIEPGHPYMIGATGPLSGARLLFTGNAGSVLSAVDAENWSTELGRHLGIRMQAVEDSLCNWQKSPSNFIAFRG